MELHKNSKKESDPAYWITITIVSGLILLLFLFSWRSLKVSDDKFTKKNQTDGKGYETNVEDVSISEYFDNHEDLSGNRIFGPDPFQKTCSQVGKDSESPSIVSNTVCLR